MDMKKFDLKYFLIILIVILLGYLLYINYFENKTLESFQVRNSLSSYYQSDDDSDLSNLHEKNELRYTVNNVSYDPSLWNTSFNFDDNDDKKNYVTFLQINKDLLFVINLEDYVISGPDKDPYKLSDTDDKQCLPGMLIARGELNHSENMFYMKEVYCSNNKKSSGAFAPFGEEITKDDINLFYGFIDENGDVNIVHERDDGTKIGSAVLEKKDGYKFGPSAQYLLRTSYNVPAPNVKNSIYIDPDVCKNSSFGDYKKGDLTKCYIKTDGLPTPDEKTGNIEGDVYSWNEYGTGCANITESKDFQACPDNIKNTCFIPIKKNNGGKLDKLGDYEKCMTNFSMKIKNQSSLMYPYYLKEKTSGNMLDLCNHLEGFQSKKYNAAIIMYVDNLSNVQSLNYDFFGIEKGQNYLTTKLDIMFPFMNKNILNKYRDDINSEKSLRLTNCIENNMAVKNHSTLLKECQSTYNDIQDKYEEMKENIKNQSSKEHSNSFEELSNVMDNIDVKSNINKASKLLQPTVWKLNFEEDENTKKNIPSYENNCSFILSTNDKYSKESRFEKYAEFDSMKNSTNINLYKGGNKQKLVLENAHVLDSLEERIGSSNYNNTGSSLNNNISNDYILMSGNLRTYHPKKYLVPGQGNIFNPFGKQLYLQNEVKSSGKWVILGFNLTKNLDDGTSVNSYNTTLIKTLKSISDTINK
jgi:hypothetical protein